MGNRLCPGEQANAGSRRLTSPLTVTDIWLVVVCVGPPAARPSTLRGRHPDPVSTALTCTRDPAPSGDVMPTHSSFASMPPLWSVHLVVVVVEGILGSVRLQDSL